MLKSFIKELPMYHNFKLIYKKYLYGFLNNFKVLKLYSSKTGSYYLPLFSTEDSIKYHIIKNKIYQQKIVDESKKYIKSNSLVLDVGSNYGQMSIIFSKTKNNVRVLSFEAQKFIFEILKKNIKVNGANVRAYYNIVGEFSKIVNMKKTNLSKNFSWGENNVVIQKSNKNAEKIKVVKIDDLQIKKKISFIKIDAEGMDLMVMKGAYKTILRNKMPIIFEYDEKHSNYNYTFLDVKKYLNKINYSIKKKIDKKNFLVTHNKILKNSKKK
jgi:FkbM family methyltransferase